MDQTYTTRGQIFQQILGPDVKPRQNMLDEHEDFFLFTYAKMLLHKRLEYEWLLSPYTIPFYPITEMCHVEIEIKTEKV